MTLLILIGSSGCATAFPKQYDEKPFIIGHYYHGDTADKIPYTMDQLGNTDTLAGDVQHNEQLCNDIPPVVEGKSVDNENSNILQWIFKDELGMDQLSRAGAWDQSSFIFEFDSPDILVGVPANAKLVTYSPTQSQVLANRNTPAVFYNNSAYEKGFTMKVELTQPLWAQAAEDAVGADRHIANADGFIFEITYSRLSCFWCCSTKQKPDVLAGVGSPFVIYYPNDDYISNRSFTKGDAIGKVGQTGMTTNMDSGKHRVEVSIRVKAYSSSVRSGEGSYEPASFNHLFRTGPARLRGADGADELNENVKDENATAVFGIPMPSVNTFEDGKYYNYLAQISDTDKSIYFTGNSAFFNIPGFDAYVRVDMEGSKQARLTGPFYYNDNGELVNEKRPENESIMAVIFTGVEMAEIGTTDIDLGRQASSVSVMTYNNEPIKKLKINVKLSPTDDTIKTHIIWKGEEVEYGDPLPEAEG